MCVSRTEILWPTILDTKGKRAKRDDDLRQKAGSDEVSVPGERFPNFCLGGFFILLRDQSTHRRRCRLLL